MVRHIVFWNLKDEAEGHTKEENYAVIKRRLEGLVGKVPGLRKAEVGRNFVDGNYDLCLYSECDSREALEVYQNFPEHIEIKEFVKKVVSGRVACDVEL